MTPNGIKNAIMAKAAELEVAMNSGRTQEELLQIYKELKEMQFELVQAELYSQPKEKSQTGST